MPEHTLKRFDEELERLSATISEMGGLTESQFADSLRALRERDTEIAEKVIAEDPRVDALDEAVQEQTIRLLALRQPMAVDLRVILSSIKIAAALEGFEARMRDQEREFAKRMTEVAKTNKAKAVEFLRTNATKKGIVTLPSGLQYEVLKTGAGPQPRSEDTVSTHYRGTHLDGKEFDATDPQGEPATFPLSGVVPGWQEALPLMKVGSKWRLYVSPELGYGVEGSPPVIEPNEVLVFEIELMKISGQ